MKKLFLFVLPFGLLVFGLEGYRPGGGGGQAPTLSTAQISPNSVFNMLNGRTVHIRLISNGKLFAARSYQDLEKKYGPMWRMVADSTDKNDAATKFHITVTGDGCLIIRSDVAEGKNLQVVPGGLFDPGYPGEVRFYNKNQGSWETWCLKEGDTFTSCLMKSNATGKYFHAGPGHGSSTNVWGQRLILAVQYTAWARVDEANATRIQFEYAD